MSKRQGFLKRGEPVRLQVFLARSGVASRRAAEEMISHGRVEVNGEAVTAMGLTVVPGVDRVEVDGEEIKVAPTMWLALHKPKGYVTTRIDPYDRRTVYDLLPEKYHGLFHVGRLDRDSEGLLLLTNDGELANRFLHPSHGITKEYDGIVTGKPTDAALRQLVEGVELEDGVAHAESAKLMGPAGNGLSRVKLVLREGKKREVRRMMTALGHEVTSLVRRRFGPIELGELPKGKYRIVAAEELSHVRTPRTREKARDTHHAYDVEKPMGKAGKGKPEARARPTGADGEERPHGTAAEPRKPARSGAQAGPARFAGGDAPPRRTGARAGTKTDPRARAAE
ncbi:MAG TPA: pseudouridine synthase, partial [Longimicrobiaceae bacterium]|nr:pseudouridine synthase [Longimicrobiaceae bacterium]